MIYTAQLHKCCTHVAIPKALIPHHIRQESNLYNGRELCDIKQPIFRDYNYKFKLLPIEGCET